MMNTFNKLKLIGKLTAIYLRSDINMKNWKTTASGLLAALGQVLAAFDVQPEVCNAVSVLGLFLLGLFCKDSNVTGGNVK